MNISELISNLKKYERQPSDVKPVYDYVMDYMRWGLMNPGKYDFTYKYIPKKKTKRKLFYKFVRRIPKNVIIKNRRTKALIDLLNCPGILDKYISGPDSEQ